MKNMKLFSLFKKKESRPMIVNDTPISMEVKKETSIDQQIYNDVYSAQELLLQEANRILNEPFNYDAERYDTLKQLAHLGFCNTEQVKEFMNLERKREEQEELKGKIEYYNREYPLNKFITVEAVKTICAKYNLLLARSRDYIAEIPEKNQNEIVQFKVMRKDVREPDELGRGWMFFPRFELSDLGITEESCIKERIKKREQYYSEKINGCDLLIVAPEHKLDTRGKVKDGHVLKIKDPIVLQPVQGGYLIVSSWGLEASDELVVNNINN